MHVLSLQESIGVVNKCVCVCVCGVDVCVAALQVSRIQAGMWVASSPGSLALSLTGTEGGEA